MESEFLVFAGYATLKNKGLGFRVAHADIAS